MSEVPRGTPKRGVFLMSEVPLYLKEGEEDVEPAPLGYRGTSLINQKTP